MITLKNPTQSSPPPELNASLIGEKKLMNRNELQQVIINKFIKNYPNINPQLIENVVQDYLKKLNSKLTQLNLKELKKIIQNLVQDENSSKKGYASLISPRDQIPLLPNNKTKVEQINGETNTNINNSSITQTQVKKIIYPAIAQNEKGRSLSPQRSIISTSAYYEQSNQQLVKSSSNKVLLKYQRSKSPQPHQNKDTDIFSIKDVKNMQKNDILYINNNQNNSSQNDGKKSILNKANRSLSPIQQRQVILTQSKVNDDISQRQSNKPKLQSLNHKISQNIEKDGNQSGVNTIKKLTSLNKDNDQIQDSQNININLNNGQQLASNNIQNIEKIENRNTHLHEKQLDDNIKDIQKNNYNIINGSGVNQINKTSYWSHLEDVEQNLKKNDLNTNEWRKKFDNIKNLRVEQQIQQELKKEQKLNEGLDQDDDTISQKSTNETVNGYEMRKNKGALCEILSQQQYIDINYAEQVKRNLQDVNKEEEMQKKKKLDQQKYLKQFYEVQISLKKNMIEDQIEQDKQFIVMSQIIQEQEKMEQKNMELSKMIRKAREEELQSKEKERQLQKEKNVEQNKIIREKYEREEQSQKEIETQRKKVEQDFYVNAIQTHQQNNIKEQQEAEDKRQDKIYMLKYTNLLDQQEEQRLALNQQRQKELQQFIKKQVENHPKLRDKKFKQEEREFIKQKMQIMAENDQNQNKNVIQQKRQLQEQMNTFLTEQIEQKKEIQKKNFIDYDKIQQESCEAYNLAQQDQDNKIQQQRKQQELENFQYLNQQIQQNQTKNTKYFYPIAYNQIIPQSTNSTTLPQSQVQK